MRHCAAIVLTLVLVAATLAHEAGHAWALRRAGATDITITIYGAGGSCRAQARDTDALARLWYAAAGPLVTASCIVGLIATRVSLPWPHAIKSLLWLSAAIQVGILCFNITPMIGKSDGSHIVRAWHDLAAGSRAPRLIRALGLYAPAATLLFALSPDPVTALFW